MAHTEKALQSYLHYSADTVKMNKAGINKLYGKDLKLSKEEFWLILQKIYLYDFCQLYSKT